MKDYAQVIVEIRDALKLSQGEFSSMLGIESSELSKYELGELVPDLSFFNNICEKFDLTLDYFFNDEQVTSINTASDLVVATKNNKGAIFNKSKSIYITPHIYDRILLSKYNYHIVYNADDFFDEETGLTHKKAGKINYSAIIDNNGTVIEYPHLVFGRGINTFNIFGNCVANSKEDKLDYLVNYKGEILSQGFDRIKPVDIDNDLGLYYGIDYFENNGNLDIKNQKLIDKDGNLIDVTFIDELGWTTYGDIKEINSFDDLLMYIEKYGPLILDLCHTREYFENDSNYFSIIGSIANYSMKFYKENEIIKEDEPLILNKVIKVINYGIDKCLSLTDNHTIKASNKYEFDVNMKKFTTSFKSLHGKISNCVIGNFYRKMYILLRRTNLFYKVLNSKYSF